MATLKDVAQKACVDVSTVSRAYLLCPPRDQSPHRGCR